ncbi:MAG: hypothetical protein DRN95_01145 [Candidatus Hydrothermarchaeota archaeon]|nr:MAG: hypothetical protein DRN95_01145 [Candidatus Hydrothermarchaeota archaeon]
MKISGKFGILLKISSYISDFPYFCSLIFAFFTLGTLYERFRNGKRPLSSSSAVLLSLFSTPTPGHAQLISTIILSSL